MMNSWFPVAFITLNTLCSLGLIWAAVCATNHMKRGTFWLIRIGYICMGAGAFSALLAPVFLSRTPTYSEFLLMLGMVALTYSDRRRRAKLFRRRLAG